MISRQDPELDAKLNVRILIFSASLRKGSYNTKLANHAAEILEKLGIEVDRAHISDFECLSYDGDVEAGVGIPEGSHQLKRRLDACDGFIIVSPEYNSSVPGVLKNVIDWTSRHNPQPFNQHNALLLSASISMIGGNRGLWTLRVPLEHLGARVYPEMFSLARASDAFDQSGQIRDQALRERLSQTLANFVSLVESTKHYPCAKAKWYEFLGENLEAK